MFHDREFLRAENAGRNTHYRQLYEDLEGSHYALKGGSSSSVRAREHSVSFGDGAASATSIVGALRNEIASLHRELTRKDLDLRIQQEDFEETKATIAVLTAQIQSQETLLDEYRAEKAALESSLAKANDELESLRTLARSGVDGGLAVSRQGSVAKNTAFPSDSPPNLNLFGDRRRRKVSADASSFTQYDGDRLEIEWDHERKRLVKELEHVKSVGAENMRVYHNQRRYLNDEQVLALVRLEIHERSLLVDVYEETALALERALHDQILALFVSEFRATVRTQQQVAAAIINERAEGSERADLVEAKHKATINLLLQQLYTPVFRQAMTQPAARAQHTMVQRHRQQMEIDVGHYRESVRFITGFTDDYLGGINHLLSLHQDRCVALFFDSITAVTRGEAIGYHVSVSRFGGRPAPAPEPILNRPQGPNLRRTQFDRQVYTSDGQSQSLVGSPQPSARLNEPQRRGSLNQLDLNNSNIRTFPVGGATSLPRIGDMTRSTDSGLNDEHMLGEHSPSEDTTGFMATPNQRLVKKERQVPSTHTLTQYIPPDVPIAPSTSATRSLMTSTALSAHLFLSDTLLQHHRDLCLSAAEELLRLRAASFERDMALRWSATTAGLNSFPIRGSTKHGHTWMSPTLSLDLSSFTRSGLIADRCVAMVAALEHTAATPVSITLHEHLVPALPTQGAEKVRALTIAASMSGLWLEMHAEKARCFLDDHRDLLGRLHDWLPHRPGALLLTTAPQLQLQQQSGKGVPERSPSIASRGGSRLLNQAQDGVLTVLEAQRDQATVVTEWLRQELSTASQALKAMLAAHSQEAIEAEREAEEKARRTKAMDLPSTAASAKHVARINGAAKLLIPSSEYSTIHSANSSSDFIRIVEASEAGVGTRHEEHRPAALRDFDKGDLLTPSLQLALPADPAHLTVDLSVLPPKARAHLDDNSLSTHYSAYIDTRRLKPMPRLASGKHLPALALADQNTLANSSSQSPLYYFDFEAHCSLMQEHLKAEEDNIGQIAAAQSELASMTKQLGEAADDYSRTLKQVSVDVTQQRDRFASDFVDLKLQLDAERVMHTKTLEMHQQEVADLKARLLHMTVLAGEYRQLCHDGVDSLSIISLSSGLKASTEPKMAEGDDEIPFNSIRGIVTGTSSYISLYSGDWLDGTLSFWSSSGGEDDMTIRPGEVAYGGGLVAVPSAINSRLERRGLAGNTRPYSRHRLGNRLISALAVEQALEQHISIGSALLFAYSTDLQIAKEAAIQAKIGLSLSLSTRTLSADGLKRLRSAEIMSGATSLLQEHALTAVSEAAFAHHQFFAEASAQMMSMAQFSLSNKAHDETHVKSLEAEVDKIKKESETQKAQVSALLATIKEKDQRIVLLSSQSSRLTEANWASGSEIASLKAEVDLRTARIADLEQRLELLQSVLNTEMQATTDALHAQQVSLKERAAVQDLAARLSDAKRAVSAERESDQKSHRRTLQYLIEASNFTGAVGVKGTNPLVVKEYNIGVPAKGNLSSTSHGNASLQQSPIVGGGASGSGRVNDSSIQPTFHSFSQMKAYSPTRHPSPLPQLGSRQ